MRTVKDTGIKSELRIDQCSECDYRHGCDKRKDYESYLYNILHNIYTIDVHSRVAGMMEITFKCKGFHDDSMF